jgi:hypothetical protein
MAAAIYGAILAVVISLLMGAGAGRLFVPRPTLSVLMAGLFTSLLQHGVAPGAAYPAYAALTVFLSGALLLAASGVGLGSPGFADWWPRVSPAALLVTGVFVVVVFRPPRAGPLRHVPGIVQSLVLSWLAHQFVTRQLGIAAGPLLGDLVPELPALDFSLMALGWPEISGAQAAIAGVLVGIACAIALFIRDQSRSVIRRVQFGDRCPCSDPTSRRA